MQCLALYNDNHASKFFFPGHQKVSIVAKQRGEHLEPYESVIGESMSMVYVESAGEEHSTEVRWHYI